MYIPTDFQLSQGRHGLRSTNYRNTLFRQSRIPRKAKRAVGEDANPPGYLCWGRTGSLPSGSAVQLVGFNVVHETHTEISRETTPVRIENPDDPEQYVDVLQTNKMKLEKDDKAPKDNSDTKDADFDEDIWPTEEIIQFDDLGQRRSTSKTYIVNYNPPERAL